MILPLFIVTFLVSAILVFWIQPMFAKMLLPLLGGSPAVWNTAMVFFQATLLAGYAYAHLITRVLMFREQILLHSTMMVFAAFCLPVFVRQDWVIEPEVAPILWLLASMTLSVGLPFFTVSATAPLLQRWFSQTGHHHASDPYFLYGSSSFGSLIALIAYPLVLEPGMVIEAQSYAWTATYITLGLLIVACGLTIRNQVADEGRVRDEASSSAPTWTEKLNWVAYSAVPFALLLSVTSHITTDIAAVPLFWVLPLVLYLSTFVIVFTLRDMVPHRWVVMAQPIAIVAVIALFGIHRPLALTLPLHLVAFFITTLMCHGELVRRRPAAQDLTTFYLYMSLGGVLGGIFTALLAPALFDRVLEYPIAIAASCLLLPAAKEQWRRTDIVLVVSIVAAVFGAGWLMARTNPTLGDVILRFLVFYGAALSFSMRRRPLGFGMGVAAVLLCATYTVENGDVVLRDRSFYGVYRVSDTKNYRLMFQGTTLQGAQYLDPEKRRTPVSYYAPDGPIAEMVARKRNGTGLTNVGIAGLGAGGMSCLRQPGENWRFYENDPLVAKIARSSSAFHYLEDCGGNSRVILGDARLSLAKEPRGLFDLLVVDVFTTDAVPVHLMTREAITIYAERLRADGVLVLHVSNRLLDLVPVIARSTRHLGLTAMIGEKTTPGEAPIESAPSVWIALAWSPEPLRKLQLGGAWRPLVVDDGGRPWTDDFSNVVEAIRWR